MRPSPAEEFLGPALFAVDCRGSNLYVHENAVVIDKTGGGLWNMGDNNFKVIPFKSIIAIQAKLKSTLINGYIEFETANSPLSIGSDKANAPVWREMIVIITARYAGALFLLFYLLTLLTQAITAFSLREGLFIFFGFTH